MASRPPWRRPLARQCFVSLGASLGVASLSQVNAFSFVLLPNLRNTLDIDDEEASWVVSIPGVSFLAAILVTSVVMERHGRRAANLARCAALACSWLTLCGAVGAGLRTVLLVRLLQGFCLGVAAVLAPVLIAEYTSPRYRGPLLTTMPVFVATGALHVHVLGAYFSWCTVAIVCSAVTFVNMIIVFLSPETPSFLASRGEYQACEDAYRWLRHEHEEEELEKMIKATMILKSQAPVKRTGSLCMFLHTKIINFLTTCKKKEFYKPIVLVVHLNIIVEASGAITFDNFPAEMFDAVVGRGVGVGVGVDVSRLVVSTDVLRLVSSTCAILVVRRLMFLVTISLNVVAFVAIAGYVYAKTHGLLPHDHPYVGISLMHFYVFTFSVGNLVLPIIIGSEIFPLEHRGLCSMVAQVTLCVSFTLYLKYILLMLSTIGLHGTFAINAGLVSYGLLVSWLLLPETKDKTLQQIEKEFRGETLCPDVDAVDLNALMQQPEARPPDREQSLQSDELYSCLLLAEC